MSIKELIASQIDSSSITSNTKYTDHYLPGELANNKIDTISRQAVGEINRLFAAMGKPVPYLTSEQIYAERDKDGLPTTVVGSLTTGKSVRQFETNRRSQNRAFVAWLTAWIMISYWSYQTFGGFSLIVTAFSAIATSPLLIIFEPDKYSGKFIGILPDSTRELYKKLKSRGYDLYLIYEPIWERHKTPIPEQIYREYNYDPILAVLIEDRYFVVDIFDLTPAEAKLESKSEPVQEFRYNWEL